MISLKPPNIYYARFHSKPLKAEAECRWQIPIKNEILYFQIEVPGELHGNYHFVTHCCHIRRLTLILKSGSELHRPEHRESQSNTCHVILSCSGRKMKLNGFVLHFYQHRF